MKNALEVNVIGVTPLTQKELKYFEGGMIPAIVYWAFIGAYAVYIDGAVLGVW